MKPLITTVIPTYQRPNLLPRTIFSVLLQSFPFVQVCVYDNASGDETGKIVREITKIDSRVKYYCHEKNIGPHSNFNSGLQNVKTPFFSLLSDDDTIFPLFYEQALKGFEQFPEAMFVCLGSILVDENNNIVLSNSTKVDGVKFFAPGEGFKGIVNGDIPGTWTGILFRKEVRDEIGLIDVSAGPFTDAGYVWHAAARFSFVVLPTVGGILTSHLESVSGTLSPLDKKWQFWREKLIQDIISDKKIPPSIQSDLKKLDPNAFKFKKIAFYQVVKGLTEGQPEFARRAVIGVGECGHPLTSKLLQSLIWIYQSIPLVKTFLLTAKKIRHYLQKKIKYQEFTIQYDKYLNFRKQLEELTAVWQKNPKEFDINNAKKKIIQNLQFS